MEEKDKFSEDHLRAQCEKNAAGAIEREKQRLMEREVKTMDKFLRAVLKIEMVRQMQSEGFLSPEAHDQALEKAKTAGKKFLKAKYQRRRFELRFSSDAATDNFGERAGSVLIAADE